MADLAAMVEGFPASTSLLDRKLKKSSSRTGTVAFILALLGGLSYILFHLAKDLEAVTVTSIWPYLLLGLALIIALGFEFVNGFHDTANAVATVIYTHSLDPNVAVVWSGICKLAGVLVSTGTVAFAVITLLPVELILQVSSGAGFAMVFALLIAAIVWNLSTWWFGLPASSSHTMVGSIIGVGLANQFFNPHIATSGVDWEQAFKVLKVLLISPILGFGFAALLIVISKRLVKYPALYEAPKDKQPPPWPIRALMVLTCTGVSFFHGSNDGQKGMGLVMLILIGTVPPAYAPSSNDRAEVTEYIRTQKLQPDTILALRELVGDVEHTVGQYKIFKAIPAQEQTIVRNDMYVTGEALRLIQKNDIRWVKEKKAPVFNKDESAALDNYRSGLDKGTRFIPNWVKVAVALALGLGTMLGWKRVVITVGEKIGKDHMTYAQGACAGLVTMGTIFAADKFGLPVSTTHILSSGVAGTMAANGSGLRMSTIRSIAAVWVFTLPAAALLSGLLYWLFRAIS